MEPYKKRESVPPVNIGGGICLSEYEPGDQGYVCMPLAVNVPVGCDDWEQVNCPICGAECWETDLARLVLKNSKTVKAACTLCSLRMGMKRKEI